MTSTTQQRKWYPEQGKYVVPKNIPKYLPGMFDFAGAKLNTSYETIKNTVMDLWPEYHATGKPRKPSTSKKSSTQPKPSRGRDSNKTSSNAGHKDTIESSDKSVTESMDTSDNNEDARPDHQRKLQRAFKTHAKSDTNTERKLAKVFDSTYKTLQELLQNESSALHNKIKMMYRMALQGLQAGSQESKWYE